jgi:hypothetical protein
MIEAKSAGLEAGQTIDVMIGIEFELSQKAENVSAKIVNAMNAIGGTLISYDKNISTYSFGKKFTALPLDDYPLEVEILIREDVSKCIVTVKATDKFKAKKFFNWKRTEKFENSASRVILKIKTFMLEYEAHINEDDGLGKTLGKFPTMWNPGAAIAWSFPFTPIFGSFIQMKNWKQLGEIENEKKSMYWMCGSILFALTMTVFDANFEKANFSSIKFLYIAAWWFFDGRKQVKYFYDHIPFFQKRSWKKPLSISLVIFIVYVAFGTALLLSSAVR